ncbi:Uncharacterised protein [Enterobacter hormaechei]|nr:Uncharacterised protein [Enterobacter hormaechei]CZW07245.1 Uncharacterised protein [Enterobacter hormaechei]CZZ34808.1 Uncharacterised protein [Enterobacter hormaechei]SAF09704.1 Uncharacterised protein [Enterobacter hormaechei]SAH35959.1 Uncharacterised protein [Enterobacter hormaechei]
MAKNFISEQFSAMCRDLTNLSSLGSSQNSENKAR